MPKACSSNGEPVAPCEVQTTSKCRVQSSASTQGASIAGPQAAEDALSGLKSIAEVGTLFVALAFVGGWSFQASYYLGFGIDPSELDFSIPATCALAVNMLGNMRWPILLAAFLLVGLTALYAKLGPTRRALAGLSVAILLFAIAIAGSMRGRQLAAEDMLETSARLPNVGFTSKTPRDGPRCLTAGTTDCKLLLHNKGAYYFFQPITVEGAQAVHGWNLQVFAVPEIEIAEVQLVRGVQ